MPYKITCPFSIVMSHEIHTVGFRGGNSINLTLPLKLNAPLGFVGTNLEISKVDEENYHLEVISNTLATVDEQVDFVGKIAEYLSFLMARGESNAHYGTAFVQPGWLDFKADLIPADSDEFVDRLNVTDSLAINATRTIDLSDKNLPGAVHTELMRFYVDGLRAEHTKSKYFHWFLILEYLENSMRYKAMFSSNRLFDDAETRIIREAADRMSDGTRKGALLNLLSRTREFRVAKITKMLVCLGIASLPGFSQTVPLTEEVMKGIIEGRNALFHSGSEISETVLWQHLFPLATLVVEYVSCNPACLD